MLVVAVTGWAGVRSRRAARAGWRAPDLAAAAGSGARLLLVVLVALRGVAGLLLVSFGAWSAWHPAGFIVAGLGLLADRLADERPKRERRPE